MYYTGPCRHPLDLAGIYYSGISHTVCMFHTSFEHVGDGLNSAVRVGRKTGKVIFRPRCPEIIQHQERIELRNFVTAECPVQVNAGTFYRRVSSQDTFDCTNLCHKEENRR
jgi:hypothetical protein